MPSVACEAINTHKKNYSQKEIFLWWPPLEELAVAWRQQSWWEKYDKLSSNCVQVNSVLNGAQGARIQANQSSLRDAIP